MPKTGWPPPIGTARGPRRAALRSFLSPLLVVVAGLLAVTALFGVLGWTWLLWIGVGVVAGVVAGRATRAWAGLLGVVAYYTLSIGLDLPRDTGNFWLVAAVASAAVLGAGFVVGSQLALRQSPIDAARTAWRGAGRWRRRIIVGAAVVALVGFVGYTAYIARIGSEEFIHPAVTAADCRTPADMFGWEYDAINYDKADDARLTAANTNKSNCSSQGSVAGTDVVTPDGIRLAGWYIPAASGVGPTGPTLIIVPGWKTNKTGVLKYGPPFHAAYNLVFLDLRNSGRSSGTETTMGLKEQTDVIAMLDWLVRAKNPSWIGAVGDSMGAAAALAATNTDARVKALILDSAHAQIVTAIGNVLETEHGQPALPGAWAIITAVSLAVGGDVTAIDPVRIIGAVGDRPVLLIHGTADLVDPPAESADLTFHAALAAGIDVELQYCQGAPHGQVIDRCPNEWARWALSFLDRARSR